MQNIYLLGWLSVLWFLSGIIMVTLWPIIYNLIIIPNLEKKLGQKLIFRGLRYEINSTRYITAKWIEIAWYIVKRATAYKLFGDQEHFPTLRWDKALLRAHYPVRLFSRFEIIMSFIALIPYFYFYIFIFLFAWPYSFYFIFGLLVFGFFNRIFLMIKGSNRPHPLPPLSLWIILISGLLIFAYIKVYYIGDLSAYEHLYRHQPHYSSKQLLDKNTVDVDNILKNRPLKKENSD
jgi:hypothetical protein